MTARSRLAIALCAAVLVCAAFVVFKTPAQPGVSAQSGPETVVSRPAGQPAPSRLFGAATSRENDFFINSLLSIYRDRYVPQAPRDGGHFRLAQSSRDKSSRGGAAPATEPDTPAAGKSRSSTLAIIHGDAKVDRSIETKPQQRQLKPDVIKMVGPFSQDDDLRSLPYIPPTEREETEELRMRHTPAELMANSLREAKSDGYLPYKAPDLAPSMPAPIQTFAGMTQAQACGGCLPPDTDGDVGPNHYVQAVNSSFAVYSKAGAVLAGPTTFNSFFSPMGSSTPCGANQNDGDPVVFYDHMADRWVVTDFAFPGFPGTSFYQCIGVSKTSNPVSGGWWLYAVQVDPANANYLGDYPKFGMWPDAYYYAVNEFSTNTTFNGVRVYALDRKAMINGGPANTVAFSVLPADLGDQYSFVPASFRMGAPPPVGQPEWFVSVNSSSAVGTSETQVFVRRFHVDFATPANSTFGVGASHAPDGVITVNGFVDAFTSSGTQIVPNGTATTTQFVDTLGDKLMYPVIYQNLGGTESLYANQSVNNNQAGTGPVSVRWYQFNMTGNTIPATPAQQQTFNNTADGIWRWMPSINVDYQGNMAIGYSASSTTVNPEIRYAGRLAADPANDLVQGEATLITSAGHQTNSNTSGGGRWGDYSTLFVDPTDGCTFFHTNEYYTATSAAAWATRVGSFKFAGCTQAPQGTAHFTITNCASGALIGGASVTIDGMPYGGTQTNGVYDGLFLAPGVHTYSVTKANNSTASGNFTIVAGQTTNVNACINSGSVHFVVTDCNTTLPLSGASVTVDGNAAGTTDAGGFFDSDEPAGNHTYQVSKALYTNASGNFNITLGQTTNVPACLNGIASLTITKIADSPAVVAGQSVGYTVTIGNIGSAAATTLAFADSLPGGASTNWAIDVPNSDTGWAITGPAGSQSLTYAPTSLAANTSKKVHITSTTAAACATSVILSNTATVSAGNASLVQATSAIGVVCPPASAGPITVTASAGTVGPTDYATLQLAFAAINAGTHQGTINVFVLGDTTEIGSAVLNGSGTGSALYTSVFVVPSGARTISGSLAAPLVDLAGADNVIIDGVNSGGRSLTLSNTSAVTTSGTSTIRFINGATANTVRNTTILGSSTASNTTAGGDVLFSTSTVAGGNSNNTISNNDIGAAGGLTPTKAVMGLGTTANPNTGNVITGNNIHDFFLATGSNSGVDIQGNNNGWTISNNRLYQTASRTFTTAGQRYSGILINSTTGTFTITGNTIGFGAANGTGTTTISGTSNEVRGIALTNTNLTAPYTTVSNNVISGINQTTSRASTSTDLASFIGLQSGTSSADAPGNFTGNTIGSLDGSSTIVVAASSTTVNTVPVQGILDFNFVDAVTISGNNIGSITINNGGTGTIVGFRGILVAGTTGTTHTVSNNTIGGPTAAGGITDNIVGGNSMYGIQVSSTTGIVTGNTVRNLTGNSTLAASIISSGLVMSGGTGPAQVSRNTIHSLTNNSGAASNSIYGISMNVPATGVVVERNLIHSFNMTSSVTTGQLVGIIAQNATGAATYKNNMIRLGIDSTGASVTPGFQIMGIWDGNGTNNLYFNSSYIGGTGVASASTTFACFSQVTTNVRNYLDNICMNARSNASGTGKNYAISVAGTAPNPAGLTSNYNDLYVTGTGGFVGLFNAVDQATIFDWRAATGQDASSYSIDPSFINPGGGSSKPVQMADSGSVVAEGSAIMPDGTVIAAPAAVVDLHIQSNSGVRFAGTPVAGVTDDFDGNARVVPVDMGADQVIGFPTAAGVTISGRVMTPDGRGLRNAVVTITDTNGGSRTVVTGALGYYSFADVAVGQSFIVSVGSQRYSYSPKLIQVSDGIADLDFVPGD